MLIQLKNAQSRGHEKALIPFSKMNLAVAELLKKSGFIDGVDKKKKKSKKSEHNYIDIRLKYDNGQGAIGGVKLVSKPSRRVYTARSAIKPVMGGQGVSVLTTPKGIMTGAEAKKQGVGGETLFHIW